MHPAPSKTNCGAHDGCCFLRYVYTTICEDYRERDNKFKKMVETKSDTCWDSQNAAENIKKEKQPYQRMTFP